MLSLRERGYNQSTITIPKLYISCQFKSIVCKITKCLGAPPSLFNSANKIISVEVISIEDGC
jgi:hypothetical protein